MPCQSDTNGDIGDDSYSRTSEDRNAKCEAHFEAKAPKGSRAGGWCLRRVLVAHGRRIRGSSRWPRCVKFIVAGRRSGSRDLSHMRRRSSTSTWGRSMFSTRRTQNALLRFPNNMPNDEAAERARGCGRGCREAVEAVEGAPEAAVVAAAELESGEVVGGAVAAAACRGELAASARLEHFPLRTDAARHRV